MEISLFKPTKNKLKKNSITDLNHIIIINAICGGEYYYIQKF